MLGKGTYIQNTYIHYWLFIYSYNIQSWNDSNYINYKHFANLHVQLTEVDCQVVCKWRKVG